MRIAAALTVVLCLVSCSSELADRCVPAAEVVATYEPKTEPLVHLTNAWMVESRDSNLESWFFISAMVEGGGFDGQIATWQFPGFDGEVDPVNTPSLSIAAEEVSAAIYGGTQPLLDDLEPETYGVKEWSDIEGFDISRQCLDLAD